MSVPLSEDEVLQPTYTAGTYDYRGTAYVGNAEYGISRTYINQYGGYYIDKYTLSKVYNTEGYTDGTIIPDETNYRYGIRYNYYRRDHLGNNREVWATEQVNYGGTIPAFISQRTQYYPSGLPWAESTGASVQNKKYNGKEFIEAHGLDEYDSQARMYYPAIMRTTTIDPLAEKYYSISPYAWCGNNPVNRIDLDGKSDYYITWTGHIGRLEKTLDKTDRLILANRDNKIFINNDGNYVSQHITIKDQKLLPALKDAPASEYNGHYSTTSNKEDAFNLFKFAADNTQAEWGINGYNTKSGEQYLIRTSNSRGEVSGTDGDFNKTDMFLNMHSHWQKDDKSVASGYNNGQVAEGDWRSVNRTYNTFKETNKDYPSQYPNFYIYHVNNRQIYRFTPLNPSIPGRKIKTYEDLYK